MNYAKKLMDMGITLTEGSANNPSSAILNCKQSGNMLYVSGHGSTSYVGKVGREFSIEEGRAAAREAIIKCIDTVYHWTGDLNKVKSIVKLLGMVNSAPEFVDQPKVINGATETLVELFGDEIGKHARSAVGVVSLPGGIAVEIEMVVELAD